MHRLMGCVDAGLVMLLIARCGAEDEDSRLCLPTAKSVEVTTKTKPSSLTRIMPSGRGNEECAKPAS
jgi:hypothetical protein